eukprot:TRINITY_DN4024_c0_g1_i1.p1 TRINITY_DN4024_c0_g1~~TRINITY_DN4024_c0_g1_i1.p1  ORF type:complete len:471 (-),score=91.95 TRINITY_DN4024_c0_g1_i1:85-1449(-)
MAIGYSEVGLPSTDEENDEKARTAAYAAARVFEKMDFEGELQLEAGSIYGAALAFPQIARSSGWQVTYSFLALRSYILLIINVFLQASLCLYIGQASQIMSVLGGQMHLCDFAANLNNCDVPDGEPVPHDCTGPGGTVYGKTRLYSYTQWAIQNFVKNSMKTVFPEKEAFINSHIDAGEYGIENYWCRLICCFLFAMSVVSDFVKCVELMKLLSVIPSEDQQWIKYVPLSECDHSRAHGSFVALGLVDFKVAGMSWKWKILNVCFILLPKLLIWWMVVWQGFRLLMETAGIFDCVLGSMAMSFVLGIDEMVLDTFGSHAAKHIMEVIDGYMYTSHADEVQAHPRHETDDQALERCRAEADEASKQHMKLFILLPRNLLVVSAVMTAFIAKYYYMNCTRTSDGSWVSKDMYTPESVSYGFMNLLSDCLELVPGFGGKQLDPSPFWSMPTEVQTVG